MEVIDFEQNCQEDIQINTKLEEFKQKSLVLRSMDYLNKKTQQMMFRKAAQYEVADLKIIKQSTQICDATSFPLKKLYSLDQNKFNRAAPSVIDPEQLPTRQINKHRKKLTIEKRLNNANLLEGPGIGRLKAGEAIFATWQNGVAVGQVKIVYPSGSIYIGSVKNYIRHGLGVFLFKKGGCYQGEFKDGKIDGFGVLSDMNGQIVDRGIWRNGCLIQRTS